LEKAFISKFDIMLGKPYNDYKDKVKGPFIVTEKLDGHRRVLVKENGKGTLFTRSGIVDEGLINIEAEIQYLPDNTVFDGECLAIGEFANALELRQATNSIMNRDGVRTGVTYNIFDSLPLKDFKNGLSIESARSRKIMTGAIFKDYSILKLAMGPIEANNLSALLDKYDHKFSFIKSVPIMGLAYTEDEILVYANEIWAKKFEGVMALQSDSKYETKRSPNLLKVKTTDSYDLPIVDTVEGTGKFAGMLGSFIVEYKGYRVGVGSGLTDSERVKYWAGREGLVGVKIEIDTFGETKNKDGSISLNCPIYKGVRHDKTVV
jgi:DNA ligase-1